MHHDILLDKLKYIANEAQYICQDKYNCKLNWRFVVTNEDFIAIHFNLPVAKFNGIYEYFPLKLKPLSDNAILFDIMRRIELACMSLNKPMERAYFEDADKPKNRPKKTSKSEEPTLSKETQSIVSNTLGEFNPEETKLIGEKHE